MPNQNTSSRCHRRRHRGRRALCDFPGGSRVTIHDISGCPKCRCRLLAMGLTPGTTAEVFSNTSGSCCLKVRDADIVLGEGMAENVMASSEGEDLTAL